MSRAPIYKALANTQLLSPGPCSLEIDDAELSVKAGKLYVSKARVTSISFPDGERFADAVVDALEMQGLYISDEVGRLVRMDAPVSAPLVDPLDLLDQAQAVQRDLEQTLAERDAEVVGLREAIAKAIESMYADYPLLGGVVESLRAALAKGIEDARRTREEMKRLQDVADAAKLVVEQNRDGGIADWHRLELAVDGLFSK